MWTVHKTLNFQIHEMGNDFNLSLSEIRAEIERMKWEAIRRAIVLVCAAAGVMTVVSLAGRVEKTEVIGRKEIDDEVIFTG